ncbi:MAG: hypothetical protein JST21_13915 [Bacteroidetes bacterium]|nr:hypothetical protein [Bacteroidota bacterium]
MPNFTPEDLLLYEAGELDNVQSKAIAEELSSNWALREKFNVLKEAFSRINSLKLQSPRAQSIQAIMRYALHKTATV